jgi:hypothetical protein
LVLLGDVLARPIKIGALPVRGRGILKFWRAGAVLDGRVRAVFPKGYAMAMED